VPRTRKAPRKGKTRRVTQRKLKPINWVMGARTYLHRLGKKLRADDHFAEAGEMFFASRMILNAWNTGEPDLLVGMFYTPDWRAWRDITAQPKPAPVESVAT
jgi:hypothetical protein